MCEVMDTAGSSAQRKYESLRARDEQELVETWGRFSGLAKLFKPERQSTKAWLIGAEGERILAERLERELVGEAILFHDRHVRQALKNIDHIAVSSSGVWVVDAKHYKGKRVAQRDKGGLFKSDYRLYVGGRDNSKLALALEWQVTAVRSVVPWEDVPVHPVLCFIDADWGWFAKSFQQNGVAVVWPRKLIELIGAPGSLSEDQVNLVADRIQTVLLPTPPGLSGGQRK